MSNLFEAIYPLAEHEQVHVRWSLRPASEDTRQAYQLALTVPAPPLTLIEAITSAFGAGLRLPRFERPLQSALEERVSTPAFEVLGAVLLTGPDARAIDERVASLAAVFQSRFEVGFGGIQLGYPPTTQRLFLTSLEMASLWHPPSQSVLTPGVQHLKAIDGPLPHAIASSNGLYLGTHTFRGTTTQVHVPRRDIEENLSIIFGARGAGKSVAALQLLLAWLDLPEQPGAGLLDPHGTFARDAAMSIPADFDERIDLFELGDVDWIFGVSVFGALPGVPIETVIDGAFSALRAVFRDQWSETRMADVVYAVTETLCRVPGATLLDVIPLLTNAEFRRTTLQRCAAINPVTLEFWTDYNQLSAGAQHDITRPVAYRIRAFTRASAIRNLTCQPGGIYEAGLIQRGRIALFDLSGPAIHSEVDALGELLLMRMRLAGEGRLMTRQQVKPWLFIVDESTRYRGGTLPVFIREGRKWAMPLCLIAQDVAGWSEELAEAAMGNPGNLFAFRAGVTDSHRLKDLLRPFTPEQHQGLDKYQCLTKLTVHGEVQPAFVLRPQFAKVALDDARLDTIRTLTRERYGARPRAEVEQEILHQFQAREAPDPASNDHRTSASNSHRSSARPGWGDALDWD